MKAFMLFGSSGPLVVLTSHERLDDIVLNQRLHDKGLDRFIAFELPVPLVRERYGAHFDVVMRDLRETDDLRVLDYDGRRALQLFQLHELGSPQMHDVVEEPGGPPWPDAHVAEGGQPEEVPDAPRGRA